MMAGLDIVHVPYRGGGPALTDLLGGQVASAPEIPTMTEAGVANLEIDAWIGIFAPASTPPVVVARLQNDIEASMTEMKAAFERVGGESLTIARDKLKLFVEAENSKWSAVIKDAQITLDK